MLKCNHSSIEKLRLHGSQGCANGDFILPGKFRFKEPQTATEQKTTAAVRRKISNQGTEQSWVNRLSSPKNVFRIEPKYSTLSLVESDGHVLFIHSFIRNIREFSVEWTSYDPDHQEDHQLTGCSGAWTDLHSTSPVFAAGEFLNYLRCCFSDQKNIPQCLYIFQVS